MRKIIQICTIESTHTINNSVIAACDDGTLWIYDLFNGAWERLDDIPQEINSTAAKPRPTTKPVNQKRV
ncbi:hypothetical protein SAMN05660772_01871 [Pasteurella testudinis DSM 23072]|uniref:Uncharacterized protein n=1 Tax=Pasteurella testudinis DSM 23072 TaxID=1122938 RepID=A0A1W1UKC0_9PAST|nr:hypothetical protein SAMN05660772_01871 [Pasteurella testudinis DSM 23072]SUB51429.1 Uncharacterised protein [Pasteurella testudinis]